MSSAWLVGGAGGSWDRSSLRSEMARALPLSVAGRRVLSDAVSLLAYDSNDAFWAGPTADVLLAMLACTVLSCAVTIVLSMTVRSAVDVASNAGGSVWRGDGELERIAGGWRGGGSTKDESR